MTALPTGFRAAGVTAGLKPSGNPDLALVLNDGPDHHAAAVFTSNRAKTDYPLTLSKTCSVTLDSSCDAADMSRRWLDTTKRPPTAKRSPCVRLPDVSCCSD